MVSSGFLILHQYNDLTVFQVGDDPPEPDANSAEVENRDSDNENQED